MAQSKDKKMSIDQILHLVEQLPMEEQEQLRQKLNSKGAEATTSKASRHPFLDWQIDIDHLAAQQGVTQSTSIESLKSDFWPDEEDFNEFIETIHRWRHESIKRQ